MTNAQVVTLQMLVKCADIGHLAATPRTHKRWATQLEEEFFRQVMHCTWSSYAMLCLAMLCHAVLCHAMLCYSMPCYAMLCHAMLCTVTLRQQANFSDLHAVVSNAVLVPAVLCVQCCDMSAEVCSAMSKPARLVLCCVQP